jgi:hypothetical protein
VDHERRHVDRAPDGPRPLSTVRTKALLIVTLVAVTSLSAQTTQTFVGSITDDMCAKEGHASMRMGPTDAECTTACVAAHGAAYVLADGTNVYDLSDQDLPEQFAGKRVRVTGTLDAKTRTIQVKSMTLAN